MAPVERVEAVIAAGGTARNTVWKSTALQAVNRASAGALVGGAAERLAEGVAAVAVAALAASAAMAMPDTRRRKANELAFIPNMGFLSRVMKEKGSSPRGIWSCSYQICSNLARMPHRTAHTKATTAHRCFTLKQVVSLHDCLRISIKTLAINSLF
jgi:hypothetical protein